MNKKMKVCYWVKADGQTDLALVSAGLDTPDHVIVDRAKEVLADTGGGVVGGELVILIEEEEEEFGW